MPRYSYFLSYVVVIRETFLVAVCAFSAFPCVLFLCCFIPMEDKKLAVCRSSNYNHEATG